MTNEPRPLEVNLCEYATTHKDGTTTILRGWIEHWTVANISLVPTLSLYVLIEVATADLGGKDVPLGIEVKSPSQIAVGLATGSANIGAGSRSRFAVPLTFGAPEYGLYDISVRLGPLAVTTTLNVREHDAKSPN